MARLPRLRRSLDRRAPQRRMGDHRVARAVHRCGSGANQAHQARHRRHQPALPSPTDGREPHGAARPHDPGARDARRRAGRAHDRRIYARNRSRRPAPPHGRVHGHRQAPTHRNGANYLRGLMVHAARGDLPPAPVHQALLSHRGCGCAVAFRDGSCRKVRLGRAVGKHTSERARTRAT